jgi:hypothetical protein
MCGKFNAAEWLGIPPADLERDYLRGISGAGQEYMTCSESFPDQAAAGFVAISV